MSSPEVDSRGVLERSFDFTKLPNLQEVEFGVQWIGGSVLWIPMALSTLRPSTSPRLSSVQLNFSRPVIANLRMLAASRDEYNNLRRVADELVRIEREFEGAVNLTVVRDPGSAAVFDTLNVRLQLRRVADIS